MVWAWVGSSLGLLGGAFGTWCAVRSARGPRERAFLIRAAWISWTVVLAFVAGVLSVPRPYDLGLWGIYVPVLIGGVRTMNRRQEEARAADAAASRGVGSS